MTRGLTPTEHEIAALAARGWTNGEIASAVRLSPKTVEWHLTKVYRSLRLRSRTELAAAWSERGSRAQAFAKVAASGLGDHRTTSDIEEGL